MRKWIRALVLSCTSAVTRDADLFIPAITSRHVHQQAGAVDPDDLEVNRVDLAGRGVPSDIDEPLTLAAQEVLDVWTVVAMNRYATPARVT